MNAPGHARTEIVAKSRSIVPIDDFYRTDVLTWVRGFRNADIGASAATRVDGAECGSWCGTPILVVLTFVFGALGGAIVLVVSPKATLAYQFVGGVPTDSLLAWPCWWIALASSCSRC